MVQYRIPVPVLGVSGDLAAIHQQAVSVVEMGVDPHSVQKIPYRCHAVVKRQTMPAPANPDGSEIDISQVVVDCPTAADAPNHRNVFLLKDIGIDLCQSVLISPGNDGAVISPEYENIFPARGHQVFFNCRLKAGSVSVLRRQIISGFLKHHPPKNPTDNHGMAAIIMIDTTTAAMYGNTLPMASSGDTLPIAQAA